MQREIPAEAFLAILASPIWNSANRRSGRAARRTVLGRTGEM